MSKAKTTPILLVGISLFVLGILLLHIEFNTVNYLLFSDAAKFADVARNLISGLGYEGRFSFWSEGIINLSQRATFPSPWMPPLMPFSIAAFFKIFGISDFSVIATSCFYFILLVVFTFLLGRKVFSFVSKKTANVIGLLSALAVASNIDFLNYATQGATEPLFAFEIVAGAYFISLKKKWATGLGIIFMILMYFTRPQAFIYIAGLLLYWLLINFKNRKAILYFFGVIVCGLLVDKFILTNFAGRYFLYPIWARGQHALTQITTSSSSSDMLRGAIENVTILSSAKKIFYYLYNYYKLLPQIASPYMWALFIIGLFKWGKNRMENSLKLVTIFMVIVTFLVAALTIPFFRYIHPIIPLVYLFAMATLVWIVQEMINGQWLIIEKWPIVKKFNKSQVITGISTLLILFFVVGQTLGVIFLDSRFKAARTNKGKPPVYVELSWVLKENTDPEDVIITNLDTWGSWYGERKTIWFPLKPDQLMPPEGKRIPFDVIYLTSYLMDDENYYMGEEWRQIFYNPENPENEFIADNFELKGFYQMTAKETYEKQDARAVLFVRKN
jgi:4-amino-4-deoxy-L-arabinose transferase-like glycosyltransferase